MAEKKAPWRDTILEHWSTDVDPSVLSGDQYTEAGDPGEKRAEQEMDADSFTEMAMQGRFQHPQHDTSMDR
ncbi:MAG: DUF3905 domain-containing protein [Firmicutes bacterium]|nr:DUF3905 domain-containing protein [Bacillota bacterium]